MLLAECTVLTVTILLASVAPKLGSKYFESIERLLAKLARHEGTSIAVVCISALLVRAALLPVEPIPRPGLQDEFSYLLAADTFAHGRTTNPVHPMWIHFETFNVLQSPTYASKFPPMQGLILAVGQVIFGHPFWGVWLSVGMMCAAICWMLQGWLPPFWSLVGSLLVVIRLGSFSYWASSYWGGAAAAIGGALVLGAIPRIRRDLFAVDAGLLALGLIILANSRPFEGLIFGIPVMALFALIIIRKWDAGTRPALLQVLVSFLIVLMLGGCLTAYYCWRVTGSAIRMPYQLYQSTYDPVPIFVWQSLRPLPRYHSAAMMNLYTGWPIQNYLLARSHPIAMALSKCFVFCFFFLGPTLMVPFFLLGIVLPRGFAYKDLRPKTRFLLLVWCISWAGLLCSVYFSPHYAAPFTCVIYALLLIAMQQIRRWSRRRGTGLAVVRAALTTCVVMLVLRASAPWLHIPVIRPGPGTWYSPNPLVINRQIVQERLSKLPGNHLVIVRYKEDHDPFREWVNNDADIDHSKVVWAREMDPTENQRLFNYFKDRSVWLLEADEQPSRLAPYDGDAAAIRQDP